MYSKYIVLNTFQCSHVAEEDTLCTIVINNSSVWYYTNSQASELK